MRVLYIGHTYSIKANQDKIAALASRPDVELLLLTPDAWSGPLYEHKTDIFPKTKNVEHQALPSLFTGKESLYVFRKGLREAIRQFKPEVVHVEQGTYAAVYAQTIRACRQLAPDAKATFFTWWNLPTPIRGIKKILEQYNLDHSACAIAGNQDAKDLLIGKGFHRPVCVMPQIGVSLNDYEIEQDASVRKQLGLQGFVVGYIGRIAEEKGVEDLLKAMEGTSERWTLLTVGAGPFNDQLYALAKTFSIRHSHVPSVRNEEIPQYLKQLDVLVLPSRKTPEWMEQFGHIIIEAMAAGVPVVGAQTGEIPNVIADAGILVRPEMPTEIRSALSDLANNSNLHTMLVRKGRERVERLYTHEQIARQQLEVYDWMIREGKSIGELAAVR